MNWLYNEFKQTGRNYEEQSEVARYDSSHADFRNLDAEAETALRQIEADANTTLLDIGCGTGNFAIAAAAICKEVFAIDVSEAMLAEARRKASSREINNIRFESAGFLSYKHQGTPLDAVTSTFALHHLPDYWQAVALRRICDMLRPGGLLLLRDVVIPDGGDLFAPIEEFIAIQTAAGGDFLREDAEGHFREEFSTFDWVLEGILKRAGFSILSRQFDSQVLATFLCKKGS